MQKRRSRFRTIVKRTAIAVSSLIVLLLAVLWYLSPGTTSPIVDTNGNTIPHSIATIEQPVIGGIEQSLIIRGENINNPVLLFVHGGPGMSTFPFIKEQFKEMEKLFTICYWDQRGAGKSYSSSIPPESMKPDQLKKDGIEVTRYLLKKFNQPKVYILGHSWGSWLGSFMIHEHPELFHAYIGIGQMANTMLSLQKSYQFVIDEARKRNDQEVLKEMTALQIPTRDASPEEWFDYLWIERQHIFRYGGARYNVSRKITDLVMPIIMCREYTIFNKMNYKKGITSSNLYLWKYVVKQDPADLLTAQKIPVYIFQGVHDQQTNFVLAKDYFDHLKAPLKKFYAFERSAHHPHVEEFDTFIKIIRTDILGLQ